MIEEITSEILTYVILAAILGAGGFISALYRCVKKQGQRGINQSKAILLLAKNIEEQTKRDHPDYTGELFAEAEIILIDDKGNF